MYQVCHHSSQLVIGSNGALEHWRLGVLGICVIEDWGMGRGMMINEFVRIGNSLQMNIYVD